MAYTEISFSSGEPLLASKMNQISQNIRDHIHGEKGVTDRVASLIIRPESDPPPGSSLLEVQKSDGTVVAKIDIDGKITAAKFESTVPTGSPPLIISSTDLVSNLNAEFWQGKSPSDINFISASPNPAYIYYLNFFYENLEGSYETPGDAWLEIEMTNLTIDDLRKQFIRMRLRLSSGDGTEVKARFRVQKSTGETIVVSDEVSTTSTTLVWLECYCTSILVGNTYNADWGETVTLFLGLFASGTNTVHWDALRFYYAERFFRTGRVT